MFDRELTLYAFNLTYCKLLVADVPDEQFAEQPAEGFNHPAWVLGHLAAVSDFGLQILGRKFALPAEWHQLFDPGTVPSPERALYPPKAELLAAYEAGHHRLAEAVAAGADPDRLARPNPVRQLRPVLPTLGDFLAHLLTTHEATHIGQLSAWRRQLGLASVAPRLTLAARSPRG
jgi:uncharacterized damage-inducible protein DinB